MNKADRDEIKSMFDDSLNYIKEIQELNYHNLNEKLDLIHEQTKKTNGTVLKHTEQIVELQRQLPHTRDNCPQSETIEKLKNTMITASFVPKRTIWKVTAWVITTSVAITAIVVEILNRI